MSAIQRRAVEIMVVIGAAAYAAWRWYNPTIKLVFLTAILVAAIGAYNALSEGGLWARSDAGRRNEQRFITTGIGLLVIGVLLKTIGRQQLGAIGSALLVIVGLGFIFVTMFNKSGGKKKKDS